MAGNPFDQFDQQLPAGDNPFDQFDDGSAPAPVSSSGPSTRGGARNVPVVPVTNDPWAGLQSRIEGLTASTLRGIGTVSENTGDWLELNVANLSGLTPEQIQNERQLGLIFDLADIFQKSADKRNYQPATSFDQVKEAFNPFANANRETAAAEFGEPGNFNPLSIPERAATVGSFIKDQTITSLPDMIASVVSLPTYVLARDQEIAERRVELDGREGLPTLTDQVAAAPGAIIESALERVATGRLLPGGGNVAGTAAGRIGKEAVVQGGTEMLEEGAANLSETVGTNRGFSGQEFVDASLAGGIVGAPLGGGVQTVKEGVNALRPKPAPQTDTQAGANPFDQFDQAEASPAPEPVAAAPEPPAPVAPTSPAPVVPTAPSPAQPPAAAGATIQPAEPPAPQPAPIAPPEPQAAQPAPVEPQAAPQPVAAPAAPEGNRRTVTTASGRKVDTEFQVVDLSTLQAASGDLQNRDRSRVTSDLQIQNIAGSLDPERLGESAEADRGAPIIGPDNIVESGNGRVAAIRKAYESIPERAEAYRQFLQKQGYAIDGMAQPVLVRRRVTDMTPEERRAFVIESNTSATARLNSVEQAKSDADLVGDDVLQLYNGGEFGAAGNRDFIRALVGKLPQSEQSALYGTDGALSQEGIRRVQNAMLARAYDDAALLSKFTEDQDNNIRSIGGAMLDVAGAWAQLRGDVRAGRIKPEFDITQDLVDAARRITVARDRGENVREALGQIDAFNPLSPIAERLIRTFYTPDLSRAIGRDKITEALRAYTVEAQKQTNEASLFGDLPPVTPEQLLDVELGKRVDAKPAQQTSMFGASGKPAVQTAPEPQQPAPAKQQNDPFYVNQSDLLASGKVDAAGYKLEYKVQSVSKTGEVVVLVRDPQETSEQFPEGIVSRYSPTIEKSIEDLSKERNNLDREKTEGFEKHMAMGNLLRALKNADKNKSEPQPVAAKPAAKPEPQKMKPIKLTGNGENARNMMDDFISATKENPLDEDTQILNDDSAVVNIAVTWGKMRISEIRSLKPGGGRAALSLLTSLADKHGVTMTLFPKRIGDVGLSDAQLKAWYMRNGFVESGTDGELMRPPSPKAAAAPEPKPEPKPKKKPEPKAANGKIVDVSSTETGTYNDGETIGKIEYIRGKDASGETTGIVRLYDESGKLVREVEVDGLSYFDSIGFHEDVFGPDSEVAIRVDYEPTPEETRAEAARKVAEEEEMAYMRELIKGLDDRQLGLAYYRATTDPEIDYESISAEEARKRLLALDHAEMREGVYAVVPGGYSNYFEKIYEDLIKSTGAKQTSVNKKGEPVYSLDVPQAWQDKYFDEFGRAPTSDLFELRNKNKPKGDVWQQLKQPKKPAVYELIDKRWQNRVETKKGKGSKKKDGPMEDTVDTADTIDVDGVQRPRTNSDGKPIERSDEKLRNFWRWFGDSKVVDEQGRPQVVYHGTDANFVEFDSNSIGKSSGNRGFLGAGFYASPSEKIASAYGNTMPIYLRILSPLVVKDKLTESSADAINKAAGVWSFSNGNSASSVYDGLMAAVSEDPSVADAISEGLEMQGFDGVLFSGGSKNEIVVFSSGQIKSATGNSGAYGRDTGNIMEDTLSDRRTTSRANDGEDTDGIAEDEADLLAELDDKPAQNTRGRGSSPETMRVSFTDRRSWAEQAFEDAGVDPDAATLWPIDQQFAVLAQLMKDRFGITVKKTETLQGRYAVDQMLDLYRNLQFMTYTMGMPSNAMGLRGKLTLVLRKGIQYFGAFYPSPARVEGVSFPAGTVVLPKRSNSFSHEWMHALDHFLMQQFPTPGSFALLSQQVKNKGIDYAPNSVKEAFVRVMDNLFYDQASLAAKVMALELELENQGLSKTARAKAESQLETLKRGNARSKDVEASDYKKTSAGFDPGKADYWANPQEMLARAFEAYTAFKVEMAGGSTEAIAKGNLAYLSTADKRLAETFPKGDDRLRIFAAFDDMFVQLAKEQIISDGVPANAPGNVTQFDPHIWHRTPSKKAEYKGVMGAMRETADEMKASLARMRREDARPDNPKPLGQRIQDVAKEYTSVEMAAFRILEKRYPRSKALRALANLMVPEPGADRFVPRVFEDAAEIHYKSMINRLSNIMERYDLTQLDEAGTRTLRDLLISEFVPNAPDNIRKAATELRRLLDMEWYNNQQAGLDIGYTKNGFLPRLLDMTMVTTDRPGFVSAAASVYEIIFDKEFGADSTEVMDRGDNYSGVIAFLKQSKLAGLDVKPAVKLIRKLRKLGRDLKTSQDPDAVQAKIDETTEQLEEAIGDLYDDTRTAYGIRRAEHWHTAIMTADAQDFDAMSPDSRYTKSRKLPPEADKLMENYYINDPIEAIQTYFSQSSRRTEYAKRFGAKGEKMQKFFDGMTSEGVAPEDQEYVADMVSRLTGRQRQTVSPATARFLSGVQAIGLITMLPRAVWMSVGEPINAAIRTGDLRNVYMPHVNMIKGIIGTADAKEWAELARVIGLVTNAMADTLAANRFGGNYGDSVKMQRVMAQFGQRSMLHGINNASRIAVMPLQHEYLHGLARRITEGRDVANSAALMREVGISDPAAFSEWILQSDRMPTMEELFDSNGIETKFGTEWITAMHRISDQTIQNPKSYNRPKMANNPHGRLIYGILSFSMSFYENVWKRTAKQLKGMSERSGPGSAAKYAAMNVLPAMAALYVAQTLVSTLREALFNPERWEEWEKEGVLAERLLQLGFTRTFSFGLADVPIQSFTGLKYQRDLSNMFIGAVPSYFLQSMQGLLQPVVSNSDKTNNAEYKAAQSAYQLGVAPSIAYALSMAPGGKLINPLYGFGMQYFTAPASRDAVANAVVGEKDGRVEKRKAAERKAEEAAGGRKSGREDGGREGGREGGR